MCLKKEGKSRSAIVLVISPLISLIQDQVKSLQKKEIKVSFIGSGQEDASFKQILTGEMNIVYSSPEAMLSKIYFSHVLNPRGTTVEGKSDIGNFCLKDWKFSLGCAISIYLSIFVI